MTGVRPGVHRVLGRSEAIAAELRDDGWRVGVAGPTDSTAEFYAAVAAALAFPAWFGANLDALWDCLTDLTEPTVLLLHDWAVFARAKPDRWQSILAVLTERTEVEPAFAVLLL